MDLVVEMKELPLNGETVLGDKITYIPGGKGANQSYAIASAGGNVKMLGCVGSDENGEKLLRNLEQAGVDVSDIKKSEGIPTGLAIIGVSQKGDNSIIVVPGANSLFGLKYLRDTEKYIRESDYVILQMEIPQETIYEAISIAKKYGKTVILNPAPAPEEIPDRILQMVDYITPNEKEIMTISKQEGDTFEEIEAAAKILIARGVKNVLVTLGSHGAMHVTKETCQIYPGRKVEAVDTTAAGDCFNGAFVTGLSENMSIEKAIRFANVFSSVAVTRKGAQSSIPKREEVNRIFCE